MLARNDFTPERIAAYAQLAAQFGDAQFLSEEEREKSRAEIMAATRGRAKTFGSSATAR